MILIAGPCAAESEEQVMETAGALSAGGIDVFRAGVWKPRTRPGCFEGCGVEALPWLARVKRELGMRVATEVGCAEHVRAVLRAGLDMVWIGARTSANPFAVQEIADALSGMPDVTVLVKNPVNPDLELWIGAIQRLKSAGIRDIIAVHRGFSTYHPEGEERKYRNDPIWRIPLELRRRMPDLPIIGDPSHMGGKRELVEPLANQALDLGWDGLIVETHCHPDAALSDAAQQITPQALTSLLQRRRPVAQSGKNEAEKLSLEAYRKEIDALDDQLIDVLARRMDVSRRIGAYKASHGIPILQTDRYGQVMATRLEAAKARGLDETFMRQFLAALHAESARVQL